MQPLLDVVDGYGGVISLATLSAHGFIASDVTLAVKSGLLSSPRRRWVMTPNADPELAAAVRVGGHLTCVSALRRKGVWCIDDGLLHVAVDAHASHLSAPHDRTVRLADPARHGVRLHRGAAILLPGELDLATDRVPAALRHLVTCQPREDVIVALDSALNARLIGIYQVRQIFESLPKKYRHYLELIDPGSQSGLETKARLRLRSLRIPYRSQVRIGTVGRVDLLIGERFVVELDGKAWHTSAQAYAEDRRRDLELIERGYIVLRITYDQVMNHWPSVERAIRAVDVREEIPGGWRPEVDGVSISPPDDWLQRRQISLIGAARLSGCVSTSSRSFRASSTRSISLCSARLGSLVLSNSACTICATTPTTGIARSTTPRSAAVLAWS